MISPFKAASAFRKSLEARLQNRAQLHEEDLQRLRRKVAFDRFLARLFAAPHSPFYLKGGYAMEIRFANARATRDIDLTYIPDRITDIPSNNDEILAALSESTRLKLGDYFDYRVGNSSKQLVNCPYGGARFPVSAYIDGRLFVRFNLDVGTGTVSGPIELVKGTDWLSFCDIPPPTFPMISLEQQLAEKFHAYLVSRGRRENTRVKDLVDMLLLTRSRPLEPIALKQALRRAFKARLLPLHFPPPPDSWNPLFQDMAAQCGIKEEIGQAFEAMRSKWESIVRGKRLQGQGL